MTIEVVIYAYMAISVSMILFNCMYIFVFNNRARRHAIEITSFKERIKAQIQKIENGSDADVTHLEYMRKALTKVGNMMAFDGAIESIYVESTDSVKKYLEWLHPVFIHLTLSYLHKDALKLSYFPYIIRKYKIIQNKSVGIITDIMFQLLENPSIYCRENALQAIYSVGDSDLAVKALKIIDRTKSFHHFKLLTDGLSAFNGDHNRLADELWRDFDEYSIQTKRAILDYYRFNLDNCGDKLMTLLFDEQQEDEIRYACIRYFGKFYSEDVYPLLLSFASDTNDDNWVYAAVASLALEIYPTECSISVLKQNLSSPHWHVRYNASQSLSRMSISYNKLDDVMDGNDRYAREIMQYQFDQKRLNEMDVLAL